MTGRNPGTQTPSPLRSPEYLVEQREYGSVYSSWAGSEEALRCPLEGVADSVSTCCRAMADLSDNMSQDFLPVLREYVLYVESMKVSDLVKSFRNDLWKYFTQYFLQRNQRFTNRYFWTRQS